MKKLFFVLLILGVHTVFANSVTLVNNSPFPLSATLYAADGTVLGSYTLKPQAQAYWNNDDSLVNPKSSQTPYTVVWLCKAGGQYGVSSDVPPGAEVFSQGSQGPLMCSPQK